MYLDSLDSSVFTFLLNGYSDQIFESSNFINALVGSERVFLLMSMIEQMMWKRFRSSICQWSSQAGG